jgi:hypothetical protein
MVFPNLEIPAPDVALDESSTYANDVPFNQKQTVITHARHRWYEFIQMGVAGTGSVGAQYAKTIGIGAGQTMRIQFEHKPDFVTVGVDGRTANNTAHIMVYRGEPGGDGVALGQTGVLTCPGPESGIITLVNIGTTTTYGAVIAHAGFPATIDYRPGF